MRISDWSSDVCSSDLDPPDGERHRVAGKASRSETALLAGTQIVDVLFLDVERDAVAPHRRDFEQHIALFDRRADFLAEVARYQHARQRRAAAGARALIFDQAQARFGLTQARTGVG